MVSRIVLSLRKAAHSQVYQGDWTVKNLTTAETSESLSSTHHEMQFRKRVMFSMNEERHVARLAHMTCANRLPAKREQ